MSTIDTHQVVGMTCDHCARSVTAEISAVDGVTDVQVDLPTGTVQVTSDRPVPVASVREAVQEAGYTLAS